MGRASRPSALGSRVWAPAQGCAGQKDLPLTRKIRRQTTPSETAVRMKELTPEHPASGNSPVDAMLTLEKATEPKTLVFTAEQMALAERLYPCFGERFSESAVPGDLCSSDANVASPPPQRHRQGRSARGRDHPRLPRRRDSLHMTKQPRVGVALLHKSLPPFTGPVFDAFCRIEMRAALNDGADALQADLVVRLYPCNKASPHLQSRNQGRRSIATIKPLV